jgi:hypothetical protein
MANNLTDEVALNTFKRLIDPNQGDKRRQAGFLEAYLMTKGFLKPNQEFKYKTKKSGWWVFSCEYKENYVSIIRRLCEEFMNGKGMEIPTLDKK